MVALRTHSFGLILGSYKDKHAGWQICNATFQHSREMKTKKKGGKDAPEAVNANSTCSTTTSSSFSPLLDKIFPHLPSSGAFAKGNHLHIHTWLRDVTGNHQPPLKLKTQYPRTKDNVNSNRSSNLVISLVTHYKDKGETMPTHGEFPSHFALNPKRAKCAKNIRWEA